MLLNNQRFLLASLLVLSTVADRDDDHQKVYSREDFRLPLEVVPLSYKIHLTPCLDNATFDGRVEIATTPRADQLMSVTLHVHRSVTVKTVDVLFQGKSQAVKKPQRQTNETNDFYVIALERPIDSKQPEPGSVVVVMEYSGVLNDDGKGFYRSSYRNADGQTEYLATTLFEPTSARMAFPCFDEPALKARFELTVTAPEGYSALSNTPTVRPPTTDAFGRRVFTFMQTPPMSTYLVATVVSKFESTPSTSAGHKVWSRPHAKSQRDFAAEMAASVMDALVNFTGVPYEIGNITKMDNVAIPDFTVFAMENWGLVTYRTRTSSLQPPNHRRLQRARCLSASEPWVQLRNQDVPNI